MQTTDIVVVAHELRLVLGADPVPVPAPFAALLEDHCTHRPNLRTTAGTTSPWLFPGYRHGSHLHPHTLMDRIRNLGVDLLGARNAALRALVTEVPPPLAAEMLGDSHQVAHKHAELAADPYARHAAAFADRRPNPDNPQKVVRDVGARSQTAWTQCIPPPAPTVSAVGHLRNRWACRSTPTFASPSVGHQCRNEVDRPASECLTARFGSLDSTFGREQSGRLCPSARHCLLDVGELAPDGVARRSPSARVCTCCCWMSKAECSSSSSAKG
ncbi:hypothetical protein YT1_p10031 (plasmid) [Rhodococcus ruber]|nr:hypothetical protein YT1_p10031 [Rhodococcus ruber]